MESWRDVWRRGFLPGMFGGMLEALADALERDDPRLTQGSTTTPPPLACTQDWPCEAADALGFAGWQGNGLTTVGEVEEFFARACFEADQRMGGPAACRWFLNFWDDTPRGRALADLAAEIRFNQGRAPDPLTQREEAAFQDSLDAAPDEQTIRAAFADWLEDRGDPRAAGYRALAALGRVPRREKIDTLRLLVIGPVAWAWVADDSPHGHKPYGHGPVTRFALAATWVRVMEVHEAWKLWMNWSGGWREFPTRRRAEDAAARAFASLPAEEKEKILSVRLHPAAS